MALPFMYILDAFINGTVVKFKRSRVDGGKVYKFVPNWIHKKVSEGKMSFRTFFAQIGWECNLEIKYVPLSINSILDATFHKIGQTRIFLKISWVFWETEQTLTNITLSAPQLILTLTMTNRTHSNLFWWNQKVYSILQIQCSYLHKVGNI